MAHSENILFGSLTENTDNGLVKDCHRYFDIYSLKIV